MKSFMLKEIKEVEQLAKTVIWYNVSMGGEILIKNY